jgi:hypothetical protein
MAAGATYEPIATTTLSSAQNSVTFSSIPGTYTDLVLLTNAGITSGIEDIALQFNSDTGTNYSRTYMYGDGSSAVSGRNSSVARIALGTFGSGSINGINICHIQNYANTTTYKTVISRGSNASSVAIAYAGLWRSTSAITSMTLGTTGSTWMSGSTFTLYGIAAA